MWGPWVIFVRLAMNSLLPETALVISYVIGISQKTPTDVVSAGLFSAALVDIRGHNPIRSACEG